MREKYRNDPEHREARLAYQKKYSERKAAKIRAYQKKYKAEHADHLRALNAEYQRTRYATDPIFREKKKAGMRRLYATPKFRAKANADRAIRKIVDPTFRIIEAQRRRIRDALKGINKSAKTMELLGCTVEQFRAHIESLWQPGMTWKNYGYRGWHCDHVKPVARFDMADPAQQREAFGFRNLQPLWREDNQSKGCRIPA